MGFVTISIPQASDACSCVGKYLVMLGVHHFDFPNFHGILVLLIVFWFLKLHWIANSSTTFMSTKTINVLLPTSLNSLKMIKSMSEIVVDLIEITRKSLLIYLFYVTDPLIFKISNAICITSASSNIVLSNHIYHWWWLEYITLSSPKISWDPCTFDCYLISKITLDCLSKISIVWTHKPFILASILDMFLDMSLRISNIWLTCFDIVHSILLWLKLWNVLDMNNFELDAKIDFYKEVFFFGKWIGWSFGSNGQGLFEEDDLVECGNMAISFWLFVDDGTSGM